VGILYGRRELLPDTSLFCFDLCFSSLRCLHTLGHVFCGRGKPAAVFGVASRRLLYRALRRIGNGLQYDSFSVRALGHGVPRDRARCRRTASFVLPSVCPRRPGIFSAARHSHRWRFGDRRVHEATAEVARGVWTRARRDRRAQLVEPDLPESPVSHPAHEISWVRVADRHRIPSAEIGRKRNRGCGVKPLKEVWKEFGRSDAAFVSPRKGRSSNGLFTVRSDGYGKR
jgi:hypothetical protein